MVAVVAVMGKKVVAVVAIKGKKSNDFGFLFCEVLRKGVFKKIDPVDVTWSPKTGRVCSHLFS